MTLSANLFVCGVPKAGTSTLAEVLSRVDDVDVPAIKEPNYFRSHLKLSGNVFTRRALADAVTTREQYASLFSAHPHRYRADCTPYYLSEPSALERIKTVTPDAKFVVMLRDPIRRAFSHWQYNRANATERQGSFIRALEQDLPRANWGWGPDWRYKFVSDYARQLRYFATLFPADRLLVLDFDTLISDSVSIFEQIETFLDVDVESGEPVPWVNPTPGIRGGLRGKTVRVAMHAGTAIRRWVPSALRRGVAHRVLSSYRTTERSSLEPEQFEFARRSMAAEIEAMRSVLPSGVGSAWPSLHRDPPTSFVRNA